MLDAGLSLKTRTVYGYPLGNRLVVSFTVDFLSISNQRKIRSLASRYKLDRPTLTPQNNFYLK